MLPWRASRGIQLFRADFLVFECFFRSQFSTIIRWIFFKNHKQCSMICFRVEALHMDNNSIRLSRGILLLGSVLLADSNFMRSVILLCEHSEKGSVGLILNKRLSLPLSTLINNLQGWDAPIYYGGPVQQDSLFILHSHHGLDCDSIQVLPDVFLGGHCDIIIRNLVRKRADPSTFRLFLGYSGWSGKQLSYELKNGSWYLSQGSKESVFREDYRNHWRNTLKSMGNEYKLFSLFPDNPLFN